MKVTVKSLHRYYGDILRIAAIPRNHFLPEHFHRLRVNIKKINALLMLTAACVKKFDRKVHRQPLRFLFVQAGKVRELQLFIKFLGASPSRPAIAPFLKFLKNELLIEKERFFSMVSIPLKFDLAEVAFSLGKASKKKILRFLKKKEKRLHKQLLHGRITTEKLHGLRKELKVWIYTMRSLNFDLPQRYLLLAEDLGRWHDCYVIGQRIDSAIHDGFLPVKTIRILHSLRKELQLNEKKLQAAIFKQITALKLQLKIPAGQSMPASPELLSH